MSDIRLKEKHLELDGKTYVLRCNMNVLADVQETVGGDLRNAIGNKAPLRNTLIWTAAMLNDYADEQGWPERFTPVELGRRRFVHSLSADVEELVYDGLGIGTSEENDTAEGDEKN